MAKKLFALFCAALLIFCVLALTVCAEEKVSAVYVTTGGKGDGLTPETPAGTFGNAIKKLTADGTVYIVGTYRLYTNRANLPEPKYDITFKAYDKNSVFHLDGNFYIGKNTNDKTVTFDIPVRIDEGKTWKIIGGYNNIVFTEKFDVSGGDLEFYGGWNENPSMTDNAAKEATVITEIPYTITVKGGRFAKFHGGNYRENIDNYLGSLAAPVTINISGGTFGKEGIYDISTNNKNYDAFSVSGMSIIADGATLNISGGTFNTPIYIQGRTDTIQSTASDKSETVTSDPKYYAIDGDIKVNITGGVFNGGEISAYYTHAAYTTLVRGNFDVSITGGSFKAGTVIDATQVKAYEGRTEKATLTYTVKNIEPKRFDVVNGKAKSYSEPIRVVFIGDSITEGYAPSGAGVVRLTGSYPAQFLKLAEKDGREVVVSNFGIGSAGFLPATKRDYFKMLAYPMVVNETDPTYVFIAMGTNDSGGLGGTAGAYKLFEKNYRDIATRMGEKTSVEKVFITSTIYFDSSQVNGIRAAGATQNIQRRIAQELHKSSEKYEFVDLYGFTLDMAKGYKLFGYAGDADGDKLHPTADGLALMGSACYNAAFKGILVPEKDYHLTEIYLSDKGSAFGDGTKSSPINSLVLANGLAAPNKEVTFYIDGTLTLPEKANIFLTEAPSKLNIVGVGSDAKLVVDGNTLKCGTATKFDNLTLHNTYTTMAYIVGAYNDFEMTESVKTTYDTKPWSFCAGYTAYSLTDPKTTSTFDTEESLSSDKDVTVKIFGGEFTRFVFGNCRQNGKAPFGTYSGDMKVFVGGNVSISDTENYVAIVGHNYLTGSIVANISKWADREIAEYCPSGTLTSPVTYDASRNTGTVKVITPESSFDGDTDGDGILTVLDVLGMLKIASEKDLLSLMSELVK